MTLSDILRGAGNIDLSFGKSVIKVLQEKQEQYFYYKDLYANKSDDEIIKMYKYCTNGDKKVGLRLLLKERGLL